MSDADLVQLPSGTVVQDRYLILRPVGQGGVCTVYQVSDTQSNAAQMYALKELQDLSPAARKQFAREAGWLKALNHPNIPKVMAFFEWRGRLYLVMEFIAGENLEQKLDRAGGRPLPEDQVLTWVLPICDALTYMHTRVPPLLHRDVKPANIIVTPMGRPVLVDLGIAKEHGPVASKTATFVRKAGTEGYAPPEQYTQAGLSGPWSDVYGFGATVYHLLTAAIPPTAVERVALDAPLPPPSAHNPTVGKQTDAAIMRALAVRPQDRFPSMAHLKAALGAAPGAAPASGASLASPGVVGPASPHAWADSLPTVPRASARPAPALSYGATRPPATGQPVAAVSRPSRGSSSATAAQRAITARAAPVTQRVAEPAVAESPSAPPPGGRAIYWWTALAAVTVIAIAAALIVLHVYAPLDRSTPQASVSGYFAALQAQDYQRAWQYTSASQNNPASQVQFVQTTQAFDALNGRVLSIQITSSEADSGAHDIVAVLVTRQGTPPTVVSETIQLTQYGGIWLIDSIIGD